MASEINYNDPNADQEPIVDWSFDPQPEGDFSGSSEDEEFGGR